MLKHSTHPLKSLEASLLIIAAGVAASLASASAAGATAAELLEKGIYTEETVGDLDEAIEVYEKVIAEGKSARKASAQAQYRIGVCYAKQGKTSEANAAFSAVLENYADIDDVVALARDRLPRDVELLAAPWKAGEESHFHLKLPNGLDVGYQVFRIGKVQRGDREYWESSNWQLITLNGLSGNSRVLVDKEGFAPVESTWKHTMLGEATAAYENDKVVIDIANRDDPVELEFKKAAFDNEQAAQLFRLLPLKVGYKTELDIVSTLTGTLIPLGVEVTQIETIETPAGTFECFRVDLAIRQTFWISADENRNLVQFEAGGVVGKLTELRRRGADEGLTLVRDRYQVELPAGWHAYTSDGEKNEDLITTRLIPSTGLLNVRIDEGLRDETDADHKSTQAWLQSHLEEYKKRRAGVVLSAEGFQTLKVGDREGTGMKLTMEDDGKKLALWRVAVFGENSVVDVRFMGSHEEFEQLMPDMTKILQNLSVN